MIGIKQNGEKWNMIIKEEQWQFETREQMEDILKNLLDMKETHGKLKDKDRY